MRSIGLARFETDGRHVTGLGYILDDARLAVGFKRAGIAAHLYQGRREGRIAELIRPLARMRTETLVFWVSPDTAAATHQIVLGLARLNPALRFIFWGLSSERDFLADELSRHGELVSCNAPEDVLRHLAGDFFHSAAPRDDADFSPYLNDIVSADEVARLGLRLGSSIGCFEKELEWLSRQTLQTQVPVPLQAHSASGEVLSEALRLLSVLGAGQKFELRTGLEACTDAVIDRLAAAGVVRVLVPGDAGDLPATLVSCGIGVKKDDASQRGKAYGFAGAIAFHAGSYYDANISPGLYHLALPLELSAEQRREAYRWASDSMAARSAVVLGGPNDLVLEHLPDLDSPLNLETQGWPKHSYAMAMNEDGSQARIIFDGKQENQQTFRYVPLSRLSEVPPDSDTTIVVTMRTAEDADELERRLKRFHGTGVLSAAPPDRAFFFENACRWIGLGGCKLPLLRRVEIGTDLRVRACRDSGDLGSVGDTFEKLQKTAKHHQQMQEIRQGCATCIVRDQCSHCAYRPEAWGGRYCEIRQSYPHTNFYFELSEFPRMVGPSLSDRPATAELIELKVSAPGLPLQHYPGPAGGPPEKDGSRPVIVSIFDRHITWWRGTRKMVRISKPLAVMAEAWWAGAPNEIVVDKLREVFAVDDATARSSLHQGLDKLRAGGVIHA